MMLFAAVFQSMSLPPSTAPICFRLFPGVRQRSPCRATCLAGFAPHYSGWGPNRGTAARRVLQGAPWPATMQELQSRPYDTQY